MDRWRFAHNGQNKEKKIYIYTPIILRYPHHFIKTIAVTPPLHQRSPHRSMKTIAVTTPLHQRSPQRLILSSGHHTASSLRRRKQSSLLEYMCCGIICVGAIIAVWLKRSCCNQCSGSTCFSDYRAMQPLQVVRRAEGFRRYNCEHAVALLLGQTLKS